MTIVCRTFQDFRFCTSDKSWHWFIELFLILGNLSLKMFCLCRSCHIVWVSSFIRRGHAPYCSYYLHISYPYGIIDGSTNYSYLALGHAGVNTCITWNLYFIVGHSDGFFWWAYAIMFCLLCVESRLTWDDLLPIGDANLELLSDVATALATFLWFNSMSNDYYSWVAFE